MVWGNRRPGTKALYAFRGVLDNYLMIQGWGIMTENMNEAASPATHKGAGTEGSVRVLGQTAAVAGISGVLLLALKAMILVSPAVLPGSDELDALGRPNAIVATDTNAAPVVFAPVASSPDVAAVVRKPSGTSERNASNPAAPKPVTVTKPVVVKPSKPVTKPAKPAAEAEKPKGPLGGTLAPATGLLDDVLGEGTTGGLVDKADGLTGGLTGGLPGGPKASKAPKAPTTGVGAVDQVVETLPVPELPLPKLPGGLL